jgi:hypothetical protein
MYIQETVNTSWSVSKITTFPLDAHLTVFITCLGCDSSQILSEGAMREEIALYSN